MGSVSFTPLSLNTNYIKIFLTNSIFSNHLDVCLVFEVLGCNLLKLIIKSEYYGIPIHNVKTIMRQVLEGLHYLHVKCKIIHTDIKPENILVTVDQDTIKRLALEATIDQKLGRQLPVSQTCTASVQTRTKVSSKTNRNRKKKLKRRAKKNRNRLEGDFVEFLSLNTADDSNENNDNDSTLSAHQQDSRRSKNSEGNDKDSSNRDIDSNSVDTSVKSEDNSILSTSLKPSTSDSKLDPAKDIMDIDIKIADLGNACWQHQHFTDAIQTRHYRCLEVILGADYGPPADIWSAACMAFELATGDFLFEPHAGDDYSRDDDHLGHIVELLGDIPYKITQSGKHARTYFDKRGKFYLFKHVVCKIIQKYLTISIIQPRTIKKY